MAKLKFGNVLMCDHATAGSNNKSTLVNVYSGDIVIPSVPANIVTGLYLEHIPDRSGPLELKLDYKLNGRISGTLTLSAEQVIKGQVGVILLPSLPIGIESGGVLKLIATAEGYAPTTVLTKKIIVGPIPSPTA